MSTTSTTTTTDHPASSSSSSGNNNNNDDAHTILPTTPSRYIIASGAVAAAGVVSFMNDGGGSSSNGYYESGESSSSSNCCIINPYYGRRRRTSSSTKQQQGRQEIIGGDQKLAKEIADEMAGLSMSERERALDDVHGVREIQKETPEFLQDCIKKLDMTLAKMPLKNKRALSKAFFLKPKLETDQQFKLKFIRADLYDISKAAKRMCLYFEQKSILFGSDLVHKSITYEDLSPSDLLVIKSGHIVELPLKDQIGRPILLIDCSKVDFNTMESDSLCRAFWYLVMSTTNDIIGQKKGLTALIYSSGGVLGSREIISKSVKHTMKSGPIIASVPFRYSSIHFIYDHPSMDFMIKTMRLVQKKDYRLRICSHFGSELENEYKLMTYGIQAEGLLVGAKSGELPILKQYLQRRFDIDKQLLQLQNGENDDGNGNNDSNSLSTIVDYPEPNDVLIGRGAPYREFPGTQIWDKLIMSNVPTYIKSTNFEKTCLSIDMVRVIKEKYRGRFLLRQQPSKSKQQNDDGGGGSDGSGGWKILDDNTAREKAAIAFRSRSKTFLASASSSNNKKKKQHPSEQQQQHHNVILASYNEDGGDNETNDNNGAGVPSTSKRPRIV